MNFESNFRQMGWLDGGLYLTSRIVAKVSGGHANIVKYYLTAQPIGRFVDANASRSGYGIVQGGKG